MGIKNDINSTYISEYIEMNRLSLLGSSRTSVGNPSYTATSSGITYTVSNNTGQNGTLALLTTALNSYLLTASDFNNVINGTYNYLTTTNVTNAYSSSPALGLISLNAGLQLNIKFNASNTGASTLNIDSIGAVNIKKFISTGKISLEANDIVINCIHNLIYDGTDWVLLNPVNINYERFSAVDIFKYNNLGGAL